MKFLLFSFQADQLTEEQIAEFKGLYFLSNERRCNLFWNLPKQFFLDKSSWDSLLLQWVEQNCDQFCASRTFIIASPSNWILIRMFLHHFNPSTLFSVRVFRGILIVRQRWWWHNHNKRIGNRHAITRTESDRSRTSRYDKRSRCWWWVFTRCLFSQWILMRRPKLSTRNFIAKSIDKVSIWGSSFLSNEALQNYVIRPGDSAVNVLLGCKTKRASTQCYRKIKSPAIG